MKSAVQWGGLAAVLLVGAWLALPAFPAEFLADRPQSWRVVDRDGDLLREAVGEAGMRQTWAPLDRISPWIIAGTLSIEDSRFYDHGGIDLRSVARASWQNASSGAVISGASTLTMQLARLLRGHPRTVPGKVAQAIDAVRLERTADKDTLLEHYLNRAPYGAGAVGVEAASQRYFGVSAAHLSLAQSALIAGLPQAPSALNPYRNVDEDGINPAALRRQRAVLDSMLEKDRITAPQHALAITEPLLLRPVAAGRPAAMHFTELVLATDPPTGSVQTTLDIDLQRPIERMVSEHVAAHSDGGLTQAAVVVLDNARCDVLAMVGSADWWDEDSAGSVNGATARRQPGSTLKPFTYAVAFEGDYTPTSIVADIETRYLDGEGLLIHPRNYSERFSGPVLMGEALGRSLNVPAVRTANAVGIELILERLRMVGFSTFDLDIAHYGLGLTLGNGEVTLLDLAQGYAAFARGGQTCTARLLAAQPDAPTTQAFTEQASFLITNILSDEQLRIRAFGADNPLMLGYPVAVKTGTSSNWRDSWSVGYTEDFTVAVWAGDFSGRPMHRISGALGAGPLFHQVVDHLVTRSAVRRLPQPTPPPEGIESVEVCTLSGLAPNPRCPHRRAVYVQQSQTTRATCDWHQMIDIDVRNGLRASPRCPAEHTLTRRFEVLPSAYARWQSEHTDTAPPTAFSPHCPLDGITADAILLTHPNDGDVFLLEPGYDRLTQSIQLTAEVDPPVPTVTFLIDGEAVATAEWPYEASWPVTDGEHRIEVVAGERTSDAVVIGVRGPL